MRHLFFLGILFPFLFFGQQDAGFRFSTGLRLTKIGLAPVPAFSFDKPVLNLHFNVIYGRINFLPDASIGINGKPWLINFKTRFEPVHSEKFKLYVSANPFLYFHENEDPQFSDLIIAQRNITFETSTYIKLNKRLGINFFYLRAFGFDPGSLPGNYISIGPEIKRLMFLKAIKLHLRPEVFYINFEGETDGFFGNSVLQISHQKLPIAVHFQAVRRIWSNFEIDDFKWNMGISVTFDTFFNN